MDVPVILTVLGVKELKYLLPLFSGGPFSLLGISENCDNCVSMTMMWSIYYIWCFVLSVKALNIYFEIPNTDQLIMFSGRQTRQSHGITLELWLCGGIGIYYEPV